MKSRKQIERNLEIIDDVPYDRLGCYMQGYYNALRWVLEE